MDDLHKLMQMTYESEDKDGNPVNVHPEFRIAVQEDADEYGWMRIIVHAHGHNSDTLDLMVGPSNQIMALDRYKELRRMAANT